MATKFLIYRMGAFGDTLLLASLCNLLRNQYEGVHITLASNPKYAAPLLDSGLIHEILDGGSPTFHLLYNESPQENDALSRLLEHYDTSMFYTADISGEFANRLNAHELNNCLIHPPLPPFSEESHICEWILRPWPIWEKSYFEEITLKPSRNNLISANNVLEKYQIEGKFFAVHPGGGGKRKWVPPRILADMVWRRADDTGHQPVVIEGPADSMASEDFQKLLHDCTVIDDVAPKTLSAILSKSSAYFGGDSGVSHLASLYAPNATILYGPDSNMRVWHPVGSNTRCVSWETI